MLKIKKNKELILLKALELFNSEGFSNVSIRQIATAIDISHSNLIYHYKTKQELAMALHDELLEKSIILNRETKHYENFVEALYNSSLKGFEILYSYRFLMMDLHQLLKDNEALKSSFLQVEKIRSRMYREVIAKCIDEGDMRPELYRGEYTFFIEHIKIFSDAWITSSQVYHEDMEATQRITRYADLFVRLFFPYLTEKGQQAFDTFCSGKNGTADTEEAR